MSSIETAGLIALLRGVRRRPQIYADLVEEHGSALAVFEHEWGANSRQQALFKDDAMHELLASATDDLARWEREGMRPVTVLDRGYPDNLRQVHDRPPLIFVAGELTPEDARSVAVIGSRRATPAGLTRAGAISKHLVEAGFAVVSGLAAGIDTAAHEAALAAGGRTIAVLGTGLTRAYPPQNAELQRRIAEQHAVISQFWPEAPPSREAFPARNATMSGLALATVVVEATHRSGARGQAHRALNHGRPLFLTAALLDQAWARQLARKAGVHVIGSPQEITSTLEGLISTDPLVA